MKRLTYMSRFARTMTADDLQALGAQAERFNADRGITGILLCIGDTFFQIIEGGEDEIDSLYGRILADDRHKEVVCIRTELDVEARLFPEWRMRTINLDHESGDVVNILKLLLTTISGSHAILERYTQPSVSRMIRGGRNPLEARNRRRRRVVMMADVVGFARLSRKYPLDEVVALVNEVLDACSVALQARGGELTTFLGDGFLAYWPEEEADAALQAAGDCLEEIRALRESAVEDSVCRELYVGFGLSAGEVIEGNIGSERKTAYTILGEAVNLAARVQDLTRSIGYPVLVTDGVVQYATAWQFESLGRHAVRGIGADVKVFRPEGVADPGFGDQARTAPTGS